MMKEVYDWYMEHMLGIHESERKAYAKKRGKERSRKTGSSSVDLAVSGLSLHDRAQLKIDYMLDRAYRKDYGRSKWERIGAPMVANTFDQFLILNPLTPPKMRAAALARQTHELMQLRERS